MLSVNIVIMESKAKIADNLENQTVFPLRQVRVPNAT